MSTIIQLKAVQPKEVKPEKPKILIFGKPGVGKTWAALDFPGTYYCDTEGGASLPRYTEKLTQSGGVYFGPNEGSLEFSGLINQVKALATQKHPYKTLVIDSISKVFNNEIAKEAERLEDAGQKDEYGSSKKPAVSNMRKLIRWIQRLDMTVILIAHEKPEFMTIKGQREEVGQTFDCYEKLAYELHLSLNIIKNGPRYIAKIIKTRYEQFPPADTFPWSYTEFAERYGKEVIEREPEALVLATEEQLAEFKGLVQRCNISHELQIKWLTMANCESFQDFESEKISKLINYIKTNFIKE